MYQQPQNTHQTAFSHGPGYSGPPPAKKARSQPVITRYPPPPGYRGPSQPQGPYAGYGYGQVPYQPYPPNPYGATQPYLQPQWPGYQQAQYPPSGFQGTYTYPQQSSPPYAAYPTWPNVASAPPTGQPSTWPTPAVDAYSGTRHNSAPFVHNRGASTGPVDGNGDALPPPDPTSTGPDDVEGDFDDECYFSRHPDEINPALSLGLIEWKAPLPTTYPLPATFAEAEIEAVAIRKPRPLDEPSVSDYFTKDKREESLISVRLMDDWEQVKDDPIYKEFPKIPERILTLSEVYDLYRYRHDPQWEARHSTSSPSPEPSEADIPPILADVAAQNDILGNLEQVITSADTSEARDYGSTNGAGRHSRKTSGASSNTDKTSRSKPHGSFRTQEQEDVLAALGVTGSPKTVYHTPGPAIGPPPSAPTSSNSTALKPNGWSGQTNGQRRASANDTARTSDARHTETRKRSHGEFEGGGYWANRREERSQAPPKSDEPRSKHARVDDR